MSTASQPALAELMLPAANGKRVSLDKDAIASLKQNGAFNAFAWDEYPPSAILLILNNLGRLPPSFDDRWVVRLLENESKKVRLAAAATLAKSRNLFHLPALQKAVKKDGAPEVRRELVSAIGRLRDPKIVPALTPLLADGDPEIICQAIRGLLPFKDQPKVETALKKLAAHENEMVAAVIRRELLEDGASNKIDPSHPLSPDFLKNAVVLGDVLETLASVPDESFHLTFTSPPYYNAREYSTYKSYSDYLAFLRQVFAAAHKKTKEGRFLVINTSPVIVKRYARNYASKRYPIPFDIHAFMDEIGWEFVDDIVWQKPETSVKNRVAGFGQHRKPICYKPNAVTEYLMVYRKKTPRLLDWNLRCYSYKAISESRVGDKFETSNVWKIDPTFNKAHSAVFPAALCQRVVSYYSFKGDLVFDPFAGSGTFGRVAKQMGRYFFLTEKSPAYFKHMAGTKQMCIGEKFPSRFLTLAKFAREAQK